MITIFVLGIIVALLVEETTGVVPGGVIVPGFLALHVADPARLGATLLVSLAVYGIVRFLQGHVLLYGRRRFAYCVATGVAIKSAAAGVLPMLALAPAGLLVIGLVIPGLVGETFLRQGVGRTLAAMVLAVALTRVAALAVTGWMP